MTIARTIVAAEGPGTHQEVITVRFHFVLDGSRGRGVSQKLLAKLAQKQLFRLGYGETAKAQPRACITTLSTSLNRRKKSWTR